MEIPISQSKGQNPVMGNPITENTLLAKAEGYRLGLLRMANEPGLPKKERKSLKQRATGVFDTIEILRSAANENPAPSTQ
jgi:hypothetical protein